MSTFALSTAKVLKLTWVLKSMWLLSLPFCCVWAWKMSFWGRWVFSKMFQKKPGIIEDLLHRWQVSGLCSFHTKWNVSSYVRLCLSNSFAVCITARGQAVLPKGLPLLKCYHFKDKKASNRRCIYRKKPDAPPISFLFMGPPSDHLVNGMLGLKASLHSWLFNAKSIRRTTTGNCNQKWQFLTQGRHHK